ncbi:MAG: LicD family protein [Bacteroidales bacterium]|nr:LicD family protein [Lachnoclostridium sp.]MCM1385199.1 LicD family protein [Lachnoclostridium sp.]MCM1466116.1 LicD family protein [Bacteroidales bacterium]
MEFPDSYFEDEVRDGFYVSGMMKRSWAAQLEVLEDIDRVCRKHGIQYFAEWGTLLGAVRHGGFIPWDDDLDIGMKREDYNKFLTVAAELPESYGLLNYETVHEGESLWEFLTRVMNGHKICFEKQHLAKFHDFPYAVGIDIFPLDYLIGDEQAEKQRAEIVYLITMASAAIDGNKDSKETERLLRQVEEICKITIDRGREIKRQLYALEERYFMMYSEQEAEEITIMPRWVNTNFAYRFPKSYYENFILMPFENIQIPVPIGYDAILRVKYGDYVEPVRSGSDHEYPFYKRQEAILRETIGETRFTRKYNGKQIEKIVK